MDAGISDQDLVQDVAPFSCESQPPILNGAQDRSISANNSSRQGSISISRCPGDFNVHELVSIANKVLSASF